LAEIRPLAGQRGDRRRQGDVQKLTKRAQPFVRVGRWAATLLPDTAEARQRMVRRQRLAKAQRHRTGGRQIPMRLEQRAHLHPSQRRGIQRRTGQAGQNEAFDVIEQIDPDAAAVRFVDIALDQLGVEAVDRGGGIEQLKIDGMVQHAREIAHETLVAQHHMRPFRHIKPTLAGSI
jgi:hypothetical protein